MRSPPTLPPPKNLERAQGWEISTEGSLRRKKEGEKEEK